MSTRRKSKYVRTVRSVLGGTDWQQFDVTPDDDFQRQVAKVCGKGDGVVDSIAREAWRARQSEAQLIRAAEWALAGIAPGRWGETAPLGVEEALRDALDQVRT